MGQVAAGLEGLHGLRIEHKIGRKHIACGEPEHRPQPRQRAAKIRALRKSMKLIAARACPASARGRKRFKKASLICAPSPAVLSTTCPPASCRAARCHCSSGWPCTCSRGLGAVSVSERMRSPRPAASNRSGTKCGGQDSCRHPAGVCVDPQPWAGTRPTARPISTCALAEWSAPKLHTHTALPCAARARRARTDAFCYQNSSLYPTRALRYGRKLLKQLPHGLQPGGATTSVQARPRAVAPSIEAKRARRWT